MLTNDSFLYALYKKTQDENTILSFLLAFVLIAYAQTGQKRIYIAQRIDVQV